MNFAPMIKHSRQLNIVHGSYYHGSEINDYNKNSVGLRMFSSIFVVTALMLYFWDHKFLSYFHNIKRNIPFYLSLQNKNYFEVQETFKPMKKSSPTQKTFVCSSCFYRPVFKRQPFVNLLLSCNKIMFTASPMIAKSTFISLQYWLYLSNNITSGLI